MRQQFKLHGPLDPFTLLKVSQAFRELADGEYLELRYSGDQVPDELFKVLPAEQYHVVEMDQSEDPQCCRIVFRKTGTTPSESDFSAGGCQCT